MIIFTILLVLFLIITVICLFAWFTYLIAGDIILKQMKIMKSRRKKNV
jgi:hypothetical protein